jgi:hypothetical protein
VPELHSTDFKHPSKRQFAYGCAACTTEFDVSAEEELAMYVSIGVVVTTNFLRVPWCVCRRFEIIVKTT